MDFRELNKELGNADLFLIDQILKGSFHPGMRILDAGCGEGRNMIYFVRNNFSIYGIDPDPVKVSMAKLIARSSNKNFTIENILVSSIEDNPFPNEFFDVVLCINVLHSANDSEHFMRLLEAQIRILKRGGLFYISMESDMEGKSKCEKIAPRKGALADRVSLRMTSDLFNRILSLNSLIKNEPVRTLHIEETIRISGFWFRKI